MKTLTIIQAAIVLAIVAFAASCSPARQYSYYPERRSSSFSLIIDPGPGIAVNRYPDGRYYYRNSRGYTYWRGNDNRYYLDQSYLGQVHYNRREYNEWRRYDSRSHNERRHR